jgi:hypothetical protein
MSSCRIWLYTSSRNSKSEGIWLLQSTNNTMVIWSSYFHQWS